MALAAFVVDKLYGASLVTVVSGVTNNTVCFSSADHDVRPADVGSYPIAVPLVNGQFNYSYDVVLRLRMITAPNTAVSGIRIIGPINPIASGLTVRLGVTNATFTTTVASSVYATGIQHQNGSAGFYDFDTKYLSWPVSGVLTYMNTIGDITSRLVAQLEVGFSGSQSTGTTKLYTTQYRYTEN